MFILWAISPVSTRRKSRRNGIRGFMMSADPDIDHTSTSAMSVHTTITEICDCMSVRRSMWMKAMITEA